MNQKVLSWSRNVYKKPFLQKRTRIFLEGLGWENKQAMGTFLFSSRSFVAGWSKRWVGTAKLQMGKQSLCFSINNYIVKYRRFVEHLGSFISEKLTTTPIGNDIQQS
jgi:hypothetical protein